MPQVYIEPKFHIELKKALKGGLGVDSLNSSTITDEATKSLINTVINRNNTSLNSVELKKNVASKLEVYNPILASSSSWFSRSEVDKDKKDAVHSKLLTVLDNPKFSIKALNKFDNRMRIDVQVAEKDKIEASENYTNWLDNKLTNEDRKVKDSQAAYRGFFHERNSEYDRERFPQKAAIVFDEKECTHLDGSRNSYGLHAPRFVSRQENEAAEELKDSNSPDYRMFINIGTNTETESVSYCSDFDSEVSDDSLTCSDSDDLFDFKPRPRKFVR